MEPHEIQQIAMCLRKRVVPRDAEEGAALCALALKLQQAFEPKPPVPKSEKPK